MRGLPFFHGVVAAILPPSLPILFLLDLLPFFHGSSSLLSPVALFLTFLCSCWPPFWPPSPSPFCHALAGFFAAWPVFCSLRGQAVASSAFLPPYLCLWRLRVGWVVASFPWPSVSRRVASLAALCVCRLLSRSLCRLLFRSAHRFLGRSVCRLLGRSVYLLLSRSVYLLLSRSACRFLGRSVCRLLRRSVCRLLRRSLCRLLCRSMCRLLGCVECRLPGRSVCLLLTRSACRLLGRSGRTSLRQRVFPSAAPLRGAFFCSFLGLVSPAGHLLTPVFLFSIFFFPVSPSCGSLVLGPSHVWPYRHGDTGTACTSAALWDLSAIGNKAIYHHRLTVVPSVYMLIEA